MNCIICNYNDAQFSFSVTREDKHAPISAEGNRSSAKYTICNNCGCMFQTNCDDFEKAYSSGAYYAVDATSSDFYTQRFNKIISLPEKKSDNFQRVQRIKAYIEKEQVLNPIATIKTIMDIGAGLGIFLHAFLEDGWHSIAVEPDPNVCKHLRSILTGTTIYHGEIQTLPENLAENINLMTFNRVLEHIRQPALVLSEIAHLLHPNGYIYIELPDTMSYYEDGPGNEAFGYGHYAVYSPGSICILARNTGFELMHLNRVKDPSGKFTIYAFLKKAPHQHSKNMTRIKSCAE